MINEVALLFTGLFFGVHPGNKPELGFLPLPLQVDKQVYKKNIADQALFTQVDIAGSATTHSLLMKLSPWLCTGIYGTDVGVLDYIRSSKQVFGGAVL